jgi:ribonuclease R
MEINKNGDLISYELKPSIIRSKNRFSYEEAQSIIDAPDSENSFSRILREMRDFSQMLRQKRLENGSIEFETPEVRFILDEQGKPVEIKPIERLQSHELIEEFMLIANKTVAEHIQSISMERLKLPFLYRVHERPDTDKLANFEVFLKALGFSVKIPRKITPKKFQQIMNEVLGTKDDVLIEEVALRSMMKANYSSNNIGHFGLAFQHYTHFTSPIRRYPDLTVHRLLKKYEQSIEPKSLKETKSYLKKVAEICSDRERTALEAERESLKIKQIEWIANYIGENFTGLISGVTSNGLFVEIIPYLIEGFVKIQDMEDDYYLYDEKTFSLVGKEFGRLYRLGAEIKIQVKAVNLEVNHVDFVIIDK